MKVWINEVSCHSFNKRWSLQQTSHICSWKNLLSFSISSAISAPLISVLIIPCCLACSFFSFSILVLGPEVTSQRVKKCTARDRAAKTHTHSNRHCVKSATTAVLPSVWSLGISSVVHFAYHVVLQSVSKADFSQDKSRPPPPPQAIRKTHHTKRGGTVPCNRAFFSICCFFFLTAYSLQKGCSSFFPLRETGSVCVSVTLSHRAVRFGSRAVRPRSFMRLVVTIRQTSIHDVQLCSLSTCSAARVQHNHRQNKGKN